MFLAKEKMEVPIKRPNVGNQKLKILNNIIIILKTKPHLILQSIAENIHSNHQVQNNW